MDKKVQKNNGLSFKMEPITAGELLLKKLPDTEWVVKNLIPKDGITIISGSPASCKTWLMLKMAIDVSEGGDFISFSTKKTKVLYVDEENGEKMLQNRIRKLTDSENPQIELMALLNFKITNSGEVIEHCIKNNIGIVMIDSLVRIHSLEENSSTEMNKVYQALKEFKKNGITIIISHHNRKSGGNFGVQGDEMRGSSDILAFTDCHITLKRDKEKGVITVTQNKLRDAEETKPFRIKFISDGKSVRFEFDKYLEPREEKKTQVEIAKEKILTLLKNGAELPRKEIIIRINADGVGMSSIKDALAELKLESLLKSKSGTGREEIYSIDSLKV